MNKRLVHLKIKIKSLAAEAGIIRFETKKVSGKAKYSLNEHRTGIVREEARHSLLAYGLLRGVAYETMEKKCEESPNWKKIVEMAKRFGGQEVEVVKWVERAKAYTKRNNE